MSNSIGYDELRRVIRDLKYENMRLKETLREMELDKKRSAMESITEANRRRTTSTGHCLGCGEGPSYSCAYNCPSPRVRPYIPGVENPRLK